MSFDISDIGTWAGSLSLLAWIVYIILKESIKSKFARELEGFKAGYQKVLDENQIRFSWYHSEQAQVIKELYQKLTLLQQQLLAYANPDRDICIDDKIEKEERKKQLQTLIKVHIDCSNYFDTNKLEAVREALQLRQTVAVYGECYFGEAEWVTLFQHQT